MLSTSAALSHFGISAVHQRMPSSRTDFRFPPGHPAPPDAKLKFSAHLQRGHYFFIIIIIFFLILKAQRPFPLCEFTFILPGRVIPYISVLKEYWQNPNPMPSMGKRSKWFRLFLPVCVHYSMLVHNAHVVTELNYFKNKSKGG